MADANSTATTPEELAKQFPQTMRPFAVLYNDDPGYQKIKEPGFSLAPFSFSVVKNVVLSACLGIHPVH